MSYLNTSNVTTMTNMFENCSKLTKLDVSNFDTSNVTTMNAMFRNCSSLINLDLSSFNMNKVTGASTMFYGCAQLKTIFVNLQWTTDNIPSYMSSLMFFGCISLVGEKGTIYNENHTDATYAHIDEGETNPGYLTLII